MSDLLYGHWYSDYSNSSVGDAVYTSKEEAEAVARATESSLVVFRVNPPLDAKAEKLRRPGERFCQVNMHRDGSNVQVWDDLYPSELHPDEYFQVRVNKESVVELVSSRCWAKGKQHAVKIVNDRRTQWIAAGARYSSTPQLVHGHDYGWRKSQ